MKVLHVIPSVSPVHGGPSHAIALMERVLCDLNVAVTTATTDDDGPGRRLPISRQSAREGQATRVYRRKWSEFYKVSPGLLRWFLANVRQFDVIHIHALFSFSSVAAAFVAKLSGVPYVIRPLGVLNGYGITRRRPRLKAFSLRFVEGPILSQAAAVHFTSLAEVREAAATCIPMRGVVVPLAVELPAIVDLAALPFALGSGERAIVFLSRLDPKKNIDGLIRAFAILSGSWPNVQLVIAGSGTCEFERSLRTLVLTEGLSERVIWTGHIEGAAKWATLASAGVFALPSHSENFGIAALEALAAGCPCVLGEGIAIAAEIEAQGAALVTSPEPVHIAAAIERLLRDPVLALCMGERAARLAAEDYTMGQMGRGLIELYEDVIEGKSLRRQHLALPTGKVRAIEPVPDSYNEGEGSSGRFHDQSAMEN